MLYCPRIKIFWEGEIMASKIFVFFNCNAEKNESTMNIFYNNVTFKDTPISRRRLFQKIKAEYSAGRIKIAEENFPKIEEIITKGNPDDASKFITYGAVKSFQCL